MLIAILPRQKGFTLVELMIALALGLVVMGGALSMVTSILATNISMLKITRLDQELKAVMMMITRDLRRAGSHGRIAEDILAGHIIFPDPFSEIHVSADSHCILFSYDKESDGALDTNDRYGFRLDTEDKAIEIRKAGANCVEGGWENVTDENAIEITALEIEDLSPPSISSAGYQISLRQFHITLTGRLKENTTVRRTLRKTIKVRNNQVLAVGQ